MVIGNISQPRDWVNSSAQGSKQKVTRRHGASFFAENSRKMRFRNAQTGDERWITFILTFSDFCLQHYQVLLHVICFKNVHYRRRPFHDNLQNAAPNSNYHKQNRESTKGYSRWKVESRHGKSEELGLNNWSISKIRNQVSGRVSVPCWLATPVANAPWKPLIIRWRSCSV